MIYDVGFNLGFQGIGELLPQKLFAPRNSGGVAERQLVEDDRAHFRHKQNIGLQTG